MKFKTLSVTDSENLIKTAKPLILDCRDLKDYKAGHLDDALHVHEGLKESLVKRGDKQRSLLIPKLPLGNAVLEALASCNLEARASRT